MILMSFNGFDGITSEHQKSFKELPVEVEAMAELASSVKTFDFERHCRDDSVLCGFFRH